MSLTNTCVNIALKWSDRSMFSSFPQIEFGRYSNPLPHCVNDEIFSIDSD